MGSMISVRRASNGRQGLRVFGMGIGTRVVTMTAAIVLFGSGAASATTGTFAPHSDHHSAPPRTSLASGGPLRKSMGFVTKTAITTKTCTAGPCPITVTVKPKKMKKGTPTGGVTCAFEDQTSTATLSVIKGTSTATCTLTLPSGPDSVTATYSGDTNFASSATSKTIKVEP